MKTWNDVVELQLAWKIHPDWDIENTKGFEDWRSYLHGFRRACEQDWGLEQERKIAEKAIALDCSQSLAEYILNLEDKLARLEARLDK
jgi:hypothetical protein